MALSPIPDILKDLKELEKVLISKRISFKKIAIMHGKGQFSKIKGSVCSMPIEVANVCNILPKPSVSNGLIVVKRNTGVMHILSQFIHMLHTRH